MLYIPGKLLFIHIPRTAGNAITRTLASNLLGTDSFLLSLQSESGGPFHRHSTIEEIHQYIPDFDDIERVAVYRDQDEIIDSDYRLHLSSDATGESAWAESVRLAKTESLEEFADRRWKPWLHGKTTIEHWCYYDGINGLTWMLPYRGITSAWPRLCGMAGLSHAPELPVLDWQKQHG